MTDEAKHTPGPWNIKPLEGKYYGTEIVSADDRNICCVWNHDMAIERAPGEPRVSARETRELRVPGLTDEEWNEFLDDYLCDSHYETPRDYADALLIAAAPDMLTEAEQSAHTFEAVAKALADIGPDALADFGFTDMMHDCTARAKANRAAIAKATAP